MNTNTGNALESPPSLAVARSTPPGGGNNVIATNSTTVPLSTFLPNIEAHPSFFAVVNMVVPQGISTLPVTLVCQDGSDPAVTVSNPKLSAVRITTLHTQ